jgi:hypothetical protein
MSLEHEVARLGNALRNLGKVIASDAFAVGFQSLGQYRSALLARVEAAAPSEGDAVPNCPFCGGPPCTIVAKAAYPYGEAPKQEDYGDDGLSVRAYVFCHSCGAEGPDCEAELYSRDDYLSAKQLAVSYWSKRGLHPELEGRRWANL